MRVKVIPFGDNNYLVSDDGRVFNGSTGKELKQIITPNNGYLKVTLYRKDGKRKFENVHRLVARAFVDGYGDEVNHINGIKTDNRAKNLEWCTHGENLLHAYKTGLMPNCTSPRAIVARDVFTNEEKIFPSIYIAAKTLGVSKGNICMCCKGHRAYASGYTFSYLDGGGD